MKLAVTADLHFSAYSQDPLIENVPERLYSLESAITSMIAECRARSVYDIAFAGDLCHNKSIIHTTAQNVMLDIFQSLEYQELRFYIIDGNHDLSGKGKDSVSALKSMETISNVRWISYQSKGEAVHHIDDGRVAFIPFFPGMDEYVKKTKAETLISHFGLNEGMLSSGISIQSSISAKHLKNYKTVILGHYHLPQAMLYGKTHIYYAGSLISLDWDDKNQEKRFLILDTETHDMDSIPSEGYKKYLELNIDSDNKDAKVQEAKLLRDAGHHVKLVTSEKLELGEDMKNINIVSNAEEDITNRGITTGMDETQKFEKYMDIKKIPVEDRGSYMATAKRIVDNAVLPE